MSTHFNFVYHNILIFNAIVRYQYAYKCYMCLKNKLKDGAL